VLENKHRYNSLCLAMPNRPPRLEPFQSYDPPLYFVTLNTHRRRKLLANHSIHYRFKEFSKAALPRGIAVGRYVIMPDHIHLFVAGHYDFVLDEWVRALKRTLSTVISAQRPHWQSGFFDHLIRHETRATARNGSTLSKIRFALAWLSTPMGGRGKARLK
jgi:REP-associated tyrosine transposase